MYEGVPTYYITFEVKKQHYVGIPSYNFWDLLIKYIRRYNCRVFYGGVNVTVNDAVATRILKLLREKDMSQYRLEQKSGIQHGSMQCIMNGRNKTVTLSTVMMLAKGFDMTLTEFLNDEVFSYDDLEIEQ